MQNTSIVISLSAISPTSYKYFSSLLEKECSYRKHPLLFSEVNRTPIPKPHTRAFTCLLVVCEQIYAVGV